MGGRRIALNPKTNFWNGLALSLWLRRQTRSARRVALWKVDEQADRKAPVKTTDLGPLDLSQAKRAQCDKEVKPEGMAVLTSHTEGSGDVYRLAIFSDGMCDGGPVIVDVMPSAQ